MRHLPPNKIQRDVFVAISEICTKYDVDMAVDELGRLSSIVFEQMAEAVALQPEDTIHCPTCDSPVVETRDKLSHVERVCMSCRTLWYVDKPLRERPRSTDCPKCQGPNTWVDDGGVEVGIPPVGVCRDCKERWPESNPPGIRPAT